jgi:hypothetical protein
MLSSVVKSKKAVELSISIMRELAQSGEKGWLSVLDPEPRARRKSMGVFTSRTGAVNEY